MLYLFGLVYTLSIVSKNAPCVGNEEVANVGMMIQGVGRNLPTEICLGYTVVPLNWRWRPQIFILKILREQSNYRFRNFRFGAYLKPSVWAAWLLFRLMRNGVNPLRGLLAGRIASVTASREFGVPNFHQFGRDLSIMRTAGKCGLLLNDYSSFLEVKQMRPSKNFVITDFSVYPDPEDRLKVYLYRVFAKVLPILIDKKINFPLFFGFINGLPLWHPIKKNFAGLHPKFNLHTNSDNSNVNLTIRSLGVTQELQANDVVVANARNVITESQEILQLTCSSNQLEGFWPTYLWENQLVGRLQMPESLELKVEKFGAYVSTVNNLYHFLEETLPQIEICNLYWPERTIYLGGNVDPIIEEIATKASIAPVICVRDEEQLFFEDLIFFKQENFRNLLSSGHFVQLDDHAQLINSALGRVSTSIPNHGEVSEKIYIVRRRGLQRRLSNFKHVERTLTRLGFAFVEFETLSLSERVNLLSQCKILVGESGAGLAHSYFLDLKAKVVEIRHPDMSGSLEHLTLTTTKDLEYKVVQGKDISRLNRIVYGKDSFAADVVALIRSVTD